MVHQRAGSFRGRGALSNADGRFEATQRIAVDDGWRIPDAEADQSEQRLATELTPEKTRQVLARNDSPDVPFDRSLNPYKGCEHGCIYCFARPTHAYIGLSPGRDFETRIRYKPEAPDALEALFQSPTYRPRLIALGANTDPYQPAEKRLGISRALIDICARYKHPISIVTKSALILRDLDILAPMAEQGLAEICVSLTTLDTGLARRMEPRAASPQRRLAAIAAASEAGIPVSVLASPMIPALNDHELEAIIEQAAAAGARCASTLLLRLPLEVKTLFEEWLRHHYPDRADRVLSLVRQCHDGALYKAEFGRRMRGSGPYADALFARFGAVCGRLGLNRGRNPLRCDLFAVPGRAQQMTLL